jgi:hypothetical protein
VGAEPITKANLADFRARLKAQSGGSAKDDNK